MIPLVKPSITSKEIAYVEDAIRNGWGAQCYDYIFKFQRQFQDYIGSPYALATSSCTGALHLALASLDIKRGDEVLVPEISWIASAGAVVQTGATPVFVDVLPDSWCIDPSKAEKAITERTKAIMPVHLYGNLAEMDEIEDLAKRHKLHIIEDAAEALGSEYKGEKVGSIGNFGAFSFHGTKTATTGEGGMLVTRNGDLNRMAGILNDNGRIPEEKRPFFQHYTGFKYKISNLQAAMGCAQMDRIEELVSRKREIFALYQRRLGDVSYVSMNPEQEGSRNSYWMPTVIFGEQIQIDRDLLMEKLKEYGIITRPFFYPLSMLPMFENQPSNEVAWSLHTRGLNLPSFFEMTEDQVEEVCDTLLKLIP